jgi:hypothetical protein
MHTIHNYILFPENFDDQLDKYNAEQSRYLFKGFQMTIDLADCEIGSKLYYSKSNKDIFLGNLKALEELSDLNIGSYDLETFLNSILHENNVMAIDEVINSSCRVTVYNSRLGGLDEKFPFLFLEVVKKNENLNDLDKQIVLNLFNSYYSQNPIMIISDCSYSNGPVRCIKVPFVTNFLDLEKWLIENRKKRNFNREDFRHIENHPKSNISSHDKSPLIGGIGGQQNAEDLLENAIGDKRSISNKSDLMNFDSKNEAYIWYEYENASNQYHGYHLVKAITYEKDEIAVGKIPDRVLKILDYRLNLV